MESPKLHQIALFIASTLACTSCSTIDRSQNGQSIQTTLERDASDFRVAHRIPGLSVAVLRGGKAAYVRGFGSANLDRKEPVTPRTMFPIGSIEKQFTAAAIMRLVEEGKIALQDPVTKYLPRLETANHVVRIEQMLHQISGLQEVDPEDSGVAPSLAVEQWGPISDESVGKGFDATDDIGGFQGRKLYFTPGERFSYSQPNYDLLCYVIAALTGKTYYEAIGDVAGLAGMERFYPDWTPRPAADDPDVAQGYRQTSEGFEVTWEPNLGSAWTTALDLARWSESLEAGKVVSKASYDRMTTRARLNDGRTWPYGFGLELLDLDGRRRIAHTGRVLGFYAVLAHYPDDDLTIAIMANRNGASDIATELEPRIARRILGHDEPQVRDLLLSPQAAARLAGTYDAGAFQFDVVPNGTHIELAMRIKGGPEDSGVLDQRRLLFQGGDEFIAEGAPEWRRVKFSPSTGHATEIALGTFAQGVWEPEKPSR
jgi:CubicO group peptidase (beta-lactamase class C family)